MTKKEEQGLVLGLLADKGMSYEEFIIRGMSESHEDNEIKRAWDANWHLFLNIERMDTSKNPRKNC